MKALTLIALVTVMACRGPSGSRDTAAIVTRSVAASCFGAAVPAIDVGRVGALHLDIPLDSIRRLCPTAHDTLVP